MPGVQAAHTSARVSSGVVCPGLGAVGESSSRKRKHIRASQGFRQGPCTALDARAAGQKQQLIPGKQAFESIRRSNFNVKRPELHALNPSRDPAEARSPNLGKPDALLWTSTSLREVRLPDRSCEKAAKLFRTSKGLGNFWGCLNGCLRRRAWGLRSAVLED